jgi:formate C-acetyltransferase
MTQALIVLSYGEDSITCPGRVDQFLYPYYRRDITAGLLTYEDALEAIEEYFIKLSTSISFGTNNVTIGGIDRDGEDAVNPVSYLMIDAHRRLKGLRNGLAVRISEKTPRDFLIKACETHRYTAGIAFYNDEVVIRDLLKDDYSLEDARDYSVVGCVELTGTGNNNGYTASNSVRISAALEMALNQGCHSTVKWKQLGVKTPHPSEFKNFEEVKQAFVDQLAFSMDLMAKRSDAKDEVFAEFFPTPLLSSTIEGCVESGQDLTRGGARYNHGAVSARGLATVANSLAAIRWAVFEEKIVSMEELVNHLRNNFEEAEELRQRLIRKAPKYGNADPQVDELAVWVADVFAQEARKHHRPLGGFYRPVMVASGTHAYEGRDCGATPDGRLAKQPISNGISPANGTEVNGMTAVLNSVAAASFPPLSNGSGLNMNLNPLTIKSGEGLDKFASLIEAYFEMGGRHIQVNPMSGETLKDAQQNPKNYPDLMVKVSGYSYRFVDLSRALQNDIINRTEFGI